MVAGDNGAGVSRRKTAAECGLQQGGRRSTWGDTGEVDGRILEDALGAIYMSTSSVLLSCEYCLLGYFLLLVV